MHEVWGEFTSGLCNKIKKKKSFHIQDRHTVFKKRSKGEWSKGDTSTSHWKCYPGVNCSHPAKYKRTIKMCYLTQLAGFQLVWKKFFPHVKLTELGFGEAAFFMF